MLVALIRRSRYLDARANAKGTRRPCIKEGHPDSRRQPAARAGGKARGGMAWAGGIPPHPHERIPPRSQGTTAHIGASPLKQGTREQNCETQCTRSEKIVVPPPPPRHLTHALVQFTCQFPSPRSLKVPVVYLTPRSSCSRSMSRIVPGLSHWVGLSQGCWYQPREVGRGHVRKRRELPERSGSHRARSRQTQLLGTHVPTHGCPAIRRMGVPATKPKHPRPPSRGVWA